MRRTLAVLPLLAIPILASCSNADNPPPPPSASTSMKTATTTATTTQTDSQGGAMAPTGSPSETDPGHQLSQRKYKLTDDEKKILDKKCDFMKGSPCDKYERWGYYGMWENTTNHPEPGPEYEFDNSDEWIKDISK